MVRAIRYADPLKAVTDYVVLDTETTGVDTKVDKIIEVGLLEVRNNEIIDSFGSFVNPGCPIPVEASNVNHIYDSDVADAPTYAQIAPTLAQWLLGKTIIAHNARFDATLVVDLLNQFGYTGVIRYIDTLYYAQQTIKGMENYKLQTLAAYFGISPGNAHRAVDDTVTCHRLFQICKSMSTEDSFSQKTVSSAQLGYVKANDIVPSHPIMPSAPLYGKRIAFTGDFSISQWDIMQMAADAGAELKDRVTLDTDYLVVGARDPSYAEISEKSRKHLRAIEINQSGKGHVQLITEAEFMSMCGSVVKTVPIRAQKKEEDNRKMVQQFCPRCGSNQVEIQLHQENYGSQTITKSKSKYKEKGHGLVWWLLIGWWWWIVDLFLWITIFPLRLIAQLFKKKKYVGKTNSVSTTVNNVAYKSICLCKNCGYYWDAENIAPAPYAVPNSQTYQPNDYSYR